MERYIEQLIEDLRAIQKRALVNKLHNELQHRDIIEELEEFDSIISEAPKKPMHNIFGIDPIMFPPYEKLTMEQATKLANEILDMWYCFNIDAVFPDKFPLDKLYPLLLQKLEEPFHHFPNGSMRTGVEFCDYEVTGCPFGNKYCTCKEFIGNDEDKLYEGEELPF